MIITEEHILMALGACAADMEDYEQELYDLAQRTEFARHLANNLTAILFELERA